MTEKIARRGVAVPHEYSPDFLETVQAKRYCNRYVVSVSADEPAQDIVAKFESGVPEFSHQGYPVTSAEGKLVGVVTRRDFVNVSPSTKIQELMKRNPFCISEEQSLREAADIMTTENIGRVIVVSHLDSRIPKGIITRSDLLSAHRDRLNDSKRTKPQGK